MNLNQVFSPDNLFWKLIAKAVDFIGLSIFWAFLSLPIITVGPATCGLYRAMTHSMRKWEDDPGAFGEMFFSFKENIKKGVPITIICEIFGLLLVYGYAVMKANWGSDVGAVMFVVYDIAMIIPIGIIIYIFPTMATYNQSIKEYFVNAVFLTIRHLPTTIVLVLLYVQLVVFVIEKWYPVLFIPTLLALLTSFFLERVYKKYPTENESTKE